MRIAILGNSGAGKSTLAAELAQRWQSIRGTPLPVLDLDTIAWKPQSPPTRADKTDTDRALSEFITSNPDGVIEGCYGDLVQSIYSHLDILVHLDLNVEQCQAYCRKRPWEAHKYESPEAQTAQLGMLLKWVEGYEERSDDMSRQAHQSLALRFPGQVYQPQSLDSVQHCLEKITDQMRKL